MYMTYDAINNIFKEYYKLLYLLQNIDKAKAKTFLKGTVDQARLEMLIAPITALYNKKNKSLT